MKFYGTRTASMITSGSSRRPHLCKGYVITTTLRNRQNIWAKWFLRTSKVVFSDTIFEILGCRILFWASFSSAEWFGTEFRQFASLFVPRNGIPSCFLFRWRVWKGILRVCFYFCFHGRNPELFSLLQKGSERNSEVFCSAEQPEFHGK